MIRKFFTNEKVILLAIVLLAAITRIIEMGSMPNGIHQDEAFVALNAIDLIAEGRDSGGYLWPVYMSSWGDGQSAMYIWLLIPFLAFAKNKTNLWLIRMPQYVVSLLTILAVYGICKNLWKDSKRSLWAAFLLAICPWHFMMSRWALDANMAPGFLCFALYFFIKGCEKSKYLILSSIFYALTLYCYALTWLVVPVILVLELTYALATKKIIANLHFIISGVVFVIVATPIFTYFLVNQDVLPEIYLPFMTIYKSSGYRGAEVAYSFAELIYNFKCLLRLLIFSDTGAIWNAIKPWGLFYPIGIVFMLVGCIQIVFTVIHKIKSKDSIYSEMILVIQLFAGFLLALLVTPQFHQTNALFIPLIILEGYGIWSTIEYLDLHKTKLATTCLSAICICFITCFSFFLKDYYGPYRSLANTYFFENLGDAIEFAYDYAKTNSIEEISIEKGAQWPRVLLYTGTTPSQYFTNNLVYDEAPAPASYQKDNIIIKTRVNYDNISNNCIYVIYYTGCELFADSFNIYSFSDWRVAIPKSS